MKTESEYMSEVFRIVSGALRLDANKVRNYTAFLADKFETNGDKATANRLRKLLSESENQLHPVNVNNIAPPVDSETRLPLLEKVNLDNFNDTKMVLGDQERDIFNEFISVAKNRVEFELQNIDTSISLLIYGPPGCGKSRLAREIAKELGLNLFVARLDGLISSYLGSTSKNIRAVFEFVSKRPCVLFLDEFDAIAKLRDDAQELGELKRVVNSFLQNLDSASSQTIVIAATNHQQLLDEAVWRRFSYRLELTYPRSLLRAEMWKEFFNPFEWTSHEIEIISDLSDGFSGADIREICLRMRRQAVINNGKPSLRDAFVGLRRFSIGDGEKRKFLSNIKENDDHEVALKLKEHNPKLYSHSTLAALLDISKATSHRWAKKDLVNG